MNALRHIAIIGAGIAGLACAGRLTSAGHNVTLFDKSIRIGGRLATRSVENFAFDHGAQFITARDPAFINLLENAQACGAAALWQEDRWVGTPGMRSLAEFMAKGLDIRLGRTVTGLARHEDRWQVHTNETQSDFQSDIRFDAVLLAVPAPQARAILGSFGQVWPQIAGVRYAPCWALMLAFSDQTGFEVARLASDDPVIGWIALDSSKPGRSLRPETFMVHATPDWSRAHLEDTPEMAAQHLLARFAAMTGNAGVPTYANAHRWRYALVEKPLGKPCLWDAGLKLGACGDWALGPRVEAAFLSGEALARSCIFDNR